MTRQLGWARAVWCLGQSPPLEQVLGGCLAGPYVALAQTQQRRPGTWGERVSKAIASIFKISFCKDRTSLGNSAASPGVQGVHVGEAVWARNLAETLQITAGEIDPEKAQASDCLSFS